MEYAYAGEFRKFTEFTIKEIHPPYRSGGLKVDGKYKPRSFKETKDGLKESIYNQETSSFELIDITEEIGKEFFATYKKVFDVVLEVKTPTKILNTKKEEVEATEVSLRGLGAYKVKLMLKEDFDLEIPMNGDREAFDWEDDVYKNIIGKTYKMRVTGTGLETSYQVKEVQEIQEEESKF